LKESSLFTRWFDFWATRGGVFSLQIVYLVLLLLGARTGRYIRSR